MVCKMMVENESQIRHLIHTARKKYIMENSPNLKRAGLITLIGIASGLMKDESMAEKYVEDITNLILECIKDQDEKIRFMGIEYMYHVCKLFNDLVLINFNNIFNLLIKKIGDLKESK